MFRLIVCGLALFSALAADKKPVTLEALQHMRMPEFGGGSIWSPNGRKFVSRQGQRLMLYDVGTKTEKELLSLDTLRKNAVQPPEAGVMEWENRRVAERPIQWSQNGDAILLILNGDLFLWKEGEETRQLTRTPAAERDAKLSPDATKVSFRIDHNLYALDIASNKTTMLTTDGSATLWNGMLDWVYPEELNLGTAHWWAPDSKSIAYMQFDVSREPIYPHVDSLPIKAVFEPQRYPKAGTPNADVRIGVVGVTGGPTRWLDFGESRDHLIARLHWSPNSRDVTVHRLNRVQNKLQILANDVEANSTRTLVQESDPTWINVNDDFRYLSKGGFLLTSEKDGYRHIYRYLADSNHARQLTKGDWEVSNIACVDERNERIYYVSTEKSPLERHLYSIAFDGRKKQQLTRLAGSHMVSMSPTCEFFVDSFSNFDTPARRTLNRGEDGAEIAVLKESDRKDLDEYDILKSEIHTFKSDDGAQFYARLIKPAGFDPSKRYPAIVMVYGGPSAQTVRNSFSGVTWDQTLAHKGFVIWQMDNRGSAGRGHVWESKLYRRFGKQELADQQQGVKYLLSLGFVDPARIGIYGWSYGGFMTLYALLHAPETFAAGVAGAAVTDWRNYDTIYTERYLGLPQENEEGYKSSSPVTAASNLKGKLLLIHNIGDDNVLFANALQMTNALQLAGRQFDLQVYPQKSHGVSGKARAHMLETATAFFVDALKP